MQRWTVLQHELISGQLGKPLEQVLTEIPVQCDRGAKRNAHGNTVSWKDDKPHADIACCGGNVFRAAVLGLDGR